MDFTSLKGNFGELYSKKKSNSILGSSVVSQWYMLLYSTVMDLIAGNVV